MMKVFIMFLFEMPVFLRSGLKYPWLNCFILVHLMFWIAVMLFDIPSVHPVYCTI